MKDAKRIIKLLEEIHKKQDLYFLLAIIIDAGYTREDIRELMEIRKERM